MSMLESFFLSYFFYLKGDLTFGYLVSPYALRAFLVLGLGLLGEVNSGSLGRIFFTEL